MDKDTKIIASVFLSIGIALFAMLVLRQIICLNKMSKADMVEAVVVSVTRVGSNATGIITYEYNGKEYGPVAYGNNPYYCVGDRFEMYVYRENPKEFFADTRGDMGDLILIFLGLVFGGIGGGMFLVSFFSSSKAKRLIEKGDKLVGTVEKVIVNTSVSVNNQNPWRVICTWTDSNGELYRFKSKNIYADVTDIFKPGDDITIYVDRNNMKKNYVYVDEKMNNDHEM